MIFFDRFRKQDTQQVALSAQMSEVIKEKISLSVPFLKWKGTLSIPRVLPQSNGMVYFGNGNTYPMILTQLYFYSPTHASCIDFTVDAIIGDGYKLTKPYANKTEEGMWQLFERKNDLQRTFNYLVRDYVMHRRMYILVDKTSSIPTLTRLDASFCSIDREHSTVYYSSDWSRRTDYKEYSTNPILDRYVIVYHDESPGQDVYPIPKYNSVLDFIYLQRDLGALMKANLQNSVFANFIISFPFKPTDENEWQDISDTIQGFKSAEGDRIIALFGNSKEELPEITQLNSNYSDKQFTEVFESINKIICFSHGIPPALIGISEAGQLGDNQQVKNHFSIFKKLTADTLRSEMQDHFNKILEILGFADIEIIDFKLIDDEGIIEQ